MLTNIYVADLYLGTLGIDMNSNSGSIKMFTLDLIKPAHNHRCMDAVTPAAWDEQITLQAFFLMLSILASVFGTKQPTHTVSGECLWNTERRRRSRSCVHWCVSALSSLVRINPIKAGRAILARFVRALTSFNISFKQAWLVFWLINVCLKMKIMTGRSMIRFELYTLALVTRIWALPLRAPRSLFSVDSICRPAFKSKSCGFAVGGKSQLVWLPASWSLVGVERRLAWRPGNISPMNSCNIPASSPSTSLSLQWSLTK